MTTLMGHPYISRAGWTGPADLTNASVKKILLLKILLLPQFLLGNSAAKRRCRGNISSGIWPLSGNSDAPVTWHWLLIASLGDQQTLASARPDINAQTWLLIEYFTHKWMRGVSWPLEWNSTLPSVSQPLLQRTTPQWTRQEMAKQSRAHSQSAPNEQHNMR